jgi:hypothetical protein
MTPGHIKFLLQPFRAAREGRNKGHRGAAQTDIEEAVVRVPSGPW